MNSPCGHEDLLMVDPYGIMKEGKGGGDSTGRKGSCLFFKEYKVPFCFLQLTDQP